MAYDRGLAQRPGAIKPRFYHDLATEMKFVACVDKPYFSVTR